MHIYNIKYLGMYYVGNVSNKYVCMLYMFMFNIFTIQKRTIPAICMRFE